MRTLALYVKPAGTVVNLRITPNDQVVTYIVFVRKWVNGTSVLVDTWHPAALESPGGASVTLTPDDGFDIILKTQIVLDPDTATIDPVLSLNGAQAYTTQIPLPAAEGPVVNCEWSIIIQ